MVTPPHEVSQGSPIGWSPPGTTGLRCGTAACWLQRRRDNRAVWRRCMNSRVPHSAEFSAFTFKRDLRCSDTAPSKAVPPALQRTEVWSSGPRAREGQRGQIHIQCVLISKKTSSLPKGWKLRCQAGQDKRALWD